MDNKNTGIVTKAELSDFMSAYKKGYLHEGEIQHLELMSSVEAELEDTLVFSSLFENYQETDDVIMNGACFTSGNIEFFYKNKKHMLTFASSLADEVNAESVATYLHNTMESECSLEGIQRVLKSDKMPSAQELAGDEEDSHYIVSEWLGRMALIRFMDKLSEFAEILTTEQFVESHSNHNSDFYATEIHSVNASGIELVDADFTDAELRHCVLKGAILRGANFENADLSNTDFSGADLRGAEFVDAIIDGANFTGADLTDANFDVESFKGVVLDNVEIQGSFIPKHLYESDEFEVVEFISIDIGFDMKCLAAKLKDTDTSH